jgi:hypothetical protein
MEVEVEEVVAIEVPLLILLILQVVVVEGDMFLLLLLIIMVLLVRGHVPMLIERPYMHLIRLFYP